ncbi:hypothetical protein N9961_01600, partial [bacterium]|nr:hypothetical protein [bacterium]
MALQFRRGTDSDRLTITPAAGEPIFTSDTKELFIGDGSTTGGIDLITTKLGSISGDIIPDTDSTYDLGSPTKKFKDLHLSGNSIFLGAGLVLSNDGGTFAAKDSDNNPVVISLTSNNTGQLSEGTNLYYTTARADSAFDVRLATKTTANITEGSNLYFTNARADARITNALLDEDNMASNSATKIPSQQSVKAYVDAEVAGIVDTAPAALNTLNELAAALGDDANFSATITAQIGAKLDSAEAISLIDSAYVQARTTAGTDSAATISLIGATVDSAYVQARQTSGGGSSIDSAATIALIDSSYVQARQVDPVSAFTTVSVTGQTDIVADADAAVPDWTSGTQQAKIIRVPFANIMSGDGFGRSPSLSTNGNYAVVGSGKSSNNRGAIHFLSRSGSTWTYGQMINRTGGHASDFTGFGDHVVMSNDGTIALGAAQYDPSAANASYATGVVYLFTRTGSTWSQHSAIEPTSPSPVTNDMRFGASVDISGDNQYIVIGGPGNNKGVYIYINDGSGNFSLQQKLTTSNSGDDYGGGVAIDEDGNTIVVSHQGSGSTGKIYTYVRSGTNWTLQQTIAPSGAVDIGWDDRKGKGVAISSDGNRIAFGSGGIYSTGSSIYIWNRSGTTWTQEQNITPSHTVGSGTNQVLRFGQNVSLSNDGTRLVAGTDRFNTLSHAETGITYVFTRNGSGVWSESKILSPSDLASEDQFGLGANISGDGTTILSHSKLADLVDGSDTYTNAGAVYAFTAPVGNPLQDTLTFEAGAGITITTNATTDTVTIAGSAAGLDSASTTALVDSAYVQARQTSAGGGIDSAATTALIDSSYVQARQIKYTNADFTDSAYVTSQINSVIDAAPGALDTLNELAAALGDDANFSTTITNQIAGKLDSAQTIALVDSAYVQARQTSAGGNDSATTIALIDSDYVQSRQVTPVPAFTKVSIAGQGDVVADADAAIPNWASGTQQAKLLAADAATGDALGQGASISQDGNYAIAGAYNEDINGSNSGSAYIYIRSGTTWTQQAKIDPSDGQSDDYFGHSVDIDADGDTVVVGARKSDSNKGNVYIFTRSGTSWSQQAKLSRQGTSPNAFGNSVGISDNGNTVVVGSSGGSPSSSGYLVTYTRSGTTWSHQQTLVTSDATSNAYVGKDVSISGNGLYIAAGTVEINGSGGSGLNGSGIAYVWFYGGSSWAQQQNIYPSDAAAYDKFGGSMALDNDGDTLIVGAEAEDPSGLNSAGSVYAFTRSGTTWTQQAKLPGQVASGEFGGSVSISDDGNVAVGSARREVNSGAGVGSAYIYTRTGSTWSLAKKIFASDTVGGYLGFEPGALEISGDGQTLIAGNHGASSTTGAAYIFTAPLGLMIQDTLTLEAGTGITLTTAAGTDTVTITGSAAGLDSSAAIAIVDSAYIQARQTTYDFLDSAEAISL